MKMLIVIIALSLVFLGLNNIAHAQNSMPVIAEFFGEHFDSTYGDSMVSLDFNHDGYEDLIVCSFSYGYVSGESPSRGKVYVYFGGSGFSSSTPVSLALEGTYDGNGGLKVTYVANHGDINGDGYDDLFIGVVDDGIPRWWIYYGGNNDISIPDHVLGPFTGATANRLYWLGDVNGDGYDDIGFWYNPSYVNHFSIIWGGTFTEQSISVGEGDSHCLSAITGIGDINGDGYSDFMLCLTNSDPYSGYYLHRLNYGNAEADFSNPQVFIQTQNAITKVSKPLGDLNGDGYDDFYGYRSLAAGMHIWLGGTNIDGSVPSFALDQVLYGYDSIPQVFYGDVNGDGFDDIVAASFGARQFAVWLGKQSVNGITDLNVYRINEDFGYSVAVGDFNTDGYDDIAVSAPTQYGYVWVFGGNAQLTDTTVGNDDPLVPEPSPPMTISISPNPVSNSLKEIQVKLTCTEHDPIARIEIFNLRSQKVLSLAVPHNIDLSVHRISLPKLPVGIYIIRVNLGMKSITAKFCVLK